jgi:hypothetical protein
MTKRGGRRAVSETWYLEAPGDALTRAEREWIYRMSGDVAAGPSAPCLVHRGVTLGGSLHCSQAGAPTARIVGVDLDITRFRDRPGGSDIELVQGDSRLLGRQFDAPVHFLFVDTDHSESTVIAELLGWLPLVPVGGVVAFHDYGNAHLSWCAGVKRAVDKWDWTGWAELPARGSIRAFKAGGETQVFLEET